MPPLYERFSTARNIALVWSFTGMDSQVIHKGVPVCESGPTARSIAFVRPLTGMGSLMLGGVAR
jgi:hypothetical protein